MTYGEREGVDHGVVGGERPVENIPLDDEDDADAQIRDLGRVVPAEPDAEDEMPHELTPGAGVQGAGLGVEILTRCSTSWGSRVTSSLSAQRLLLC